MIVIFGATGNTGGEAAQKLLADKYKVRVVGRSRDKLRKLSNLGAEAVEADLANSNDVGRALEGATVAYLLIPPNMAVADFRAHQQLVTKSLVTALTASKCRKVVLLSSLGAEHASGTGPVVGLYELEQQLKQIRNLDVLSIRAGYFMENFLGNIQMIISKGIFGAPAPAEAPLSLIAAADIGRYAAKRLANPEFQGFEVVNLIGPTTINFAEVTRSIGLAIGRPDLPFVQFSYEDAQAGLVAMGLHAQMAGLYVELYKGAADGLLRPEAGTPVVNTETPFSAFAQVFAAAYRSASV
jgi:uncharacterized protein YbjT (DUF2867 family)